MASVELIEQLQSPVRNNAHCRVRFFIVDPDTDPTLSSETEEVFSNLQNATIDPLISTFNYATLEKNFWLLDGSQPLYGTKLDNSEQSYVSTYISNENGEFEEYPSYVLTSDEYLTTVGLTITFDSITEDYATNIYVKAYRDNIKIVDNNYPIEQYVARIIFADSDELIQWNRIEVYFTATDKPYRRVRVNQFIIGVLKVYEDDELISANSKEKTTKINSELPTHTFEFTIDNSDKLFNPDNPVGWYKYILERQQVIYEWGYDLDDGTTEYIDGGYMKSVGSPTVKDSQATFSSTTTLNLLTDTYNKGIYSSSGRSLYDLAVDVLTDAGVNAGSYSLWDGLKEIYTEAPLPQKEHRQLLQMIATAGNCTLYTDRYDVIYIMPFEYDVIPNNWDYDFITSIPEVTVQPQLKSSIAYLNHYKVGDETEEVYKNEELLLTETSDVEIAYNLSTNLTVSVTNGTLNSSSLYARYGILNITPSSSSEYISIIVTGNKIETAQTIDSMKYNSKGEDNEYSNDLLTSMLEQSKDTRTKVFIGDWYSQRNIYDFESRGDITVDTQQVVSLENDFTKHMVGYLVENNVDYNGAWSGSSTVMRINGKKYSDLVDNIYSDFSETYDYYKLYNSDS